MMSLYQSKRFITTTASVLGLLLSASNSNADTYTATALGTIGGSFSFAYAINNNSQVTGDSYNANGHRHATLWINGTPYDLGIFSTNTTDTQSQSYAINSLGQIAGTSVVESHQGFSGGTQAAFWNNSVITNLGSLGGATATYLAYSFAYGINNGGQVVGYSQMIPNGSGNHATLWSGGVMTDLGTLITGGTSQARAINDSGQIVGWANTAPPGYNHAVLWSNGVMTDLGTLGGHSYAYAINNNGQIVGNSSSPYHATLWSNGVITDLGTVAGGNWSEAYAINNSGQVVGYSQTSTGQRATLWSNGSAVDLNTLVTLGNGVILNEAHGINDAGQIVANGRNASGTIQSAYLLSPITPPPLASTAIPLPIPALWALALALAGISLISKRRIL